MNAKHVRATMGSWRTAIIVKDAPTVVALDLAFPQTPDRCRPALAKNAESDDDDRVRAFSTRALEKVKNPAEAPRYPRPLGDRSPYVRQDASLALGDLGAAVEPAVAELRKASRHDPVTDVQAAAIDALGPL